MGQFNGYPPAQRYDSRSDLEGVIRAGREKRTREKRHEREEHERRDQPS